jgi:CheY-like chemotaxis protein/glycine cleavage system H lipoate-binding protein
MDRKLSVLVVDDEQIILDSVKKHLKSDDYELHLVLTPREGLDKVRNEHIDVVLTDLMMPEIDGLELMKMVKEIHPNVPVIIVTGYATINTALQATQLGAFDYIAKPFSRKELLAVVRRAADLVEAVESGPEVSLETVGGSAESKTPFGEFKTLGDRSWMMLEKDGVVLLGVEQSFVDGVGKVQSIYLPSEGDEIRQGSVYLQIVSPDLRSHNVLSPLSGIVVKVNNDLLNDPNNALLDPYGDGWVVRIKPTKFDFEIKLLGL